MKCCQKQACSHGRVPDLHIPINNQPGRLWRWQGSQSPCYKLMKRKFKMKKYICNFDEETLCIAASRQDYFPTLSKHCKKIFLIVSFYSFTCLLLRLKPTMASRTTRQEMLSISMTRTMALSASTGTRLMASVATTECASFVENWVCSLISLFFVSML